MKRFFVILAVSSAFISQGYAQNATTAPLTGSKPAVTAVGNPTAPAAAPVVMCKDGTAPVGKTAHPCRGHGGMMTSASSPALAPAVTSASGATNKVVPRQTTQMSGGGAGKVWVNTVTKVYHCEGDKYYGKTKKGEYMAEVDARTKGFHGDHGKTCSK